MGMGRKNNKKKCIMSHVIMFGYGKGPTHFNAHTWVGLRVGLIIFQRTKISKMQIKN
jgi:hypothetical protein